MPGNSDKNSLIREVGDVADEVVRKASPFSIGMAIILAVIFVGVGGMVLANKDTIIRLVEAGHEVKHLQKAHDQCHEEMAALKTEVAFLRAEVNKLKDRLAEN